jgi:hypothetical protein
MDNDIYICIEMEYDQPNKEKSEEDEKIQEHGTNK